MTSVLWPAARLHAVAFILALATFATAASVNRSEYFGDWTTEPLILGGSLFLLVLSGAVSSVALMLPSLFGFSRSLGEILGQRRLIVIRGVSIVTGGLLTTTAVAHGQPLDVMLALVVLWTIVLIFISRLVFPTAGRLHMAAEVCTVLTVVYGALIGLNLALACEMAWMAHYGQVTTALEQAAIVLTSTFAVTLLYGTVERKQVCARLIFVFLGFAIVLLAPTRAFAIFAATIHTFTREGGGSATISTQDSSLPIRGLPSAACADVACTRSKELHLVFRLGDTVRFLYRTEAGSLAGGSVDMAGIRIDETSGPVFGIRLLWL